MSVIQVGVKKKNMDCVFSLLCDKLVASASIFTLARISNYQLAGKTNKTKKENDNR